MLRHSFVWVALAALAFAGCYSSQRVESSRSAFTAFDTGGTATHAADATYQNRAYRGPHFLKPRDLP